MNENGPRRIRTGSSCGRFLIKIGLEAAVLFGVLACGRSDAPDRRSALRDLNVILVTIDTLRSDFVGTYGDRARTPHVDQLAREGVVFERCIAQTPLTLPAHVSILSGTYPLYHRVRDNGGVAVPDRLELVGEVLRARGYATAAFLGAYVLHSKWGLDQGFDVYSDEFDRSRYERLRLQNEKRAEEVVALAEEWLRAHKEDRFFAWIHLYDPHAPYDPPPDFDTHPGDPYRGEVEYTDHALGGLFSFLRDEGLYDQTLLVLTADHGESLGQHGEREHGFFVYEPTVWVPLIIRAPIEFPAKRIGKIVEHVDIVPTLLDALDVPIPGSVQGESLLGVMFGDEASGDGTAYTETFYPRLHYGWSELRAVYRDGMKYVQAPEEELYELASDGEEQVNLARDEAFAGRKELLREGLTALVERCSAGALDPTAPLLSREDLDALRALGYAATTTNIADRTALPDPKAKIEVFNELNDATVLLRTEDHEGAIAAAKEILRDEPNLLEAHTLVANACQRQGKFREAAQSFDKILDLNPDSNFVMIDLVGALINLGEYEKAAEKAESFLAKFPGDAVLHEELGLARFSRREYDRALESFLASIEIEPGPFALSKAGEIYAIRGELEAAESYVGRALSMNPRNKGSYYILAQIEEARGRPDEAVDFYQKELQNDPLEYKAAYNAAVILKKQGHLDRAVPFYEKTIEANPRFNLPYFMIAGFYLERDTRLAEAIDLCKKGIGVAPEEESTLFGYEVLLRLLARTGDRAGFDLYSRRAGALAQRVEAKK